MKNLKFFTCCPDDTYYTWQVHLWLESLKKLNKSKDAVVLIYIPLQRTKNIKWDKIIELYPETTFKFYYDENDDISTSLIPIYIPILRPWLMIRWFRDNPSSNKDAIFYCDSDILFTKDFNVEKFKDDDTCYLSNTNSYISVNYFDSKIKDVLPGKKEEYANLDIFSMLGSLIGITREQGELFKEHSGGAQYLLKNLDASFWIKVKKDCIIIRTYLQKINSEFFIDESTGFQSWCADMWAILWNLWSREQKAKIISEMDFAWSTDPIEKLEKTTILHNAGITSTHMGTTPYFYKGKYHVGSDPTIDIHLDLVLKNKFTKKKCNWYYANELKELKNKYNIKY